MKIKKVNKNLQFFNKWKKNIYQQNQIEIIDYYELIDKKQDLKKKIEISYGPKGLGILLVKNIPQYKQMRTNLLNQSQILANLKQEQLIKLTRPEQNYQVGWSCGIEKFQGKPDFSKGSFYANPLKDIPDEKVNEIEKQLGIITKGNNIWPKEILPELEINFKQLGNLIHKVGLQLAYHLDQFVESNCSTYEKGKLQRILNNDDGCVGRLLHYYAQDKNDNLDLNQDNDDWCGWHNDHSALTGLTSAIFIDKNTNQEVFPQDKESGLFAKNRQSQVQKIIIIKDCLAFQIGETSQILSGGILEATPHCVKNGNLNQISRNTFAVFMGPQYQEIMNVPEGVSPMNALSKGAHKIPPLESRWNQGQTFYQFHSKTIEVYNLQS